MLVSRLLLASAASTVAFAAPSYDASTSAPAAPLFSWFTNSLTQWVSTVKPSTTSADVSVAAQYAASLVEGVNPFTRPDYSDNSIWQVIQENEHLTDLKKIVKYAGPASKDLLDDKDKKLTFLAPINWRKGKEHHHEEALSQWEPIQQQIDELENDSLWTESKKDKDRKERKKRAIAFLIDSVLKYHVIDSDKPLKAWYVAQNSSVATLLTVGKAKKVVGNLWDGEQFRLRVGKSLLPRPSAYFNFYSRLVYPDVDVGGSIVHAVSFPILIPPSTLQTLFFAQNEFSALTSALQKVNADGYFKLPINESFFHHNHSHSHGHIHQAIINGGAHQLHHHHYHPHGLGASTLFAPANLAWSRLPFKLRLFLFSPFGERVLGLILALHSLPKTIFFADWYHEIEGKSNIAAKHFTVNPVDLYSATGETAMDYANVTEYTFDTACPKLHYHKSTDAWTESKLEFETVDVRVYRYTILPGGKGPLQTRMTVNNVSVLFQDIPTGNGVFHQLERLYMPKHHPKDGIWAHAAHQAEKAGFGKIDFTEMIV